ncbi:protein FAR1-RELATED SEQUENCE 4-like [Juglans microcarpa x Juglans regia]|uniref:protein FAR1-RELATED SEQUENCE 4-like n=1 Tax=Juglans microcarpa x Juglans regia TaxID=2249226 RepID=UPI001B7DAB90|nr:protein FAR1-RELATED SEQUENCE 4-like [Juglans microcarpa x Juglans regia]
MESGGNGGEDEEERMGKTKGKEDSGEDKGIRWTECTILTNEVQIVYDSEFHDKAEDAPIKYKIIDDKNVEEPKTGMIFGSSDDIFLHYKQYANQRGFGVVQKGCKKEADETVKYVTFACVRQDCKAKINAQSSVDGKWFLTTVVLEHNHDFSPGKVRFFKCNKQMDPVMKRRLEWNDRAGITMSKNFNSLVVEAGDMDSDYRLKNVFWANVRRRASYKYFGDVITFDTTYKTNRYGMPFAPFVGVNHHGQSILLGAGLISSKNTETFV